MTLEDSIQGFRLRVLTDATRSGNVTATCARFGVSRTWFYRLRARLERYGPDGLHPKRRLGPAGPAQPGVCGGRAPGRREGAGVADARPAVGQRSARVRWRVGRPGHGVAGLASSRVEHGGRARLGARSYPQWRAWLALAYLWDRSAVNGHWVRATRPRLARDSGGRLVDATGAVMLDKRGAPVTKWKDRRTVLLDTDGRPVPTAGEAAREHNPDARLHPWLTEADIVATCNHPGEAQHPPVNTRGKA